MPEKPTPPPEPLIVGIFAAIGALACVMVFELFIPGNPDPKGYGFMATGAIAGLAGFAYGKYQMNRWLHRKRD